MSILFTIFGSTLQLLSVESLILLKLGSETPSLRCISAVREGKLSLKGVSDARSLGVDNPDVNKVFLIININKIPANAAQ